MKSCGQDEWWVDDAKLIIRSRPSDTKELWKFTLIVPVVLFGIWLNEGWTRTGVSWSIIVALSPLLLPLLTLMDTARELSLNRVSGELSERSGRRHPLPSGSEKRSPLSGYERVQLDKVKAEDDYYTVTLQGAGHPARQVGQSGQYDEALALVEALARHLRLGLQVEGGRVLATAHVREPLRTKPSGLPFMPSLPGSPFKAHTEGDRRVVVMPAPGWAGPIRGQRWLGLLLTLGGGVWSLLALRSEAGVGGWGGALFLIIGGFTLRDAWRKAHATWRFSVSAQGLEAVSTGGGKGQTVRLDARELRDIDVRDADSRKSPILVIERIEGERLAMGEGLPREELQWVASRLRQALAEVGVSRASVS